MLHTAQRLRQALLRRCGGAPVVLPVAVVLHALVVALVSTPVVKNLAIRVKAVDVPKDGRRMHDHPIPRMGGLAIFLGFLLSVLLFLELTPQMRGMLLGAVIIVVLGIFDDIYSLPAMFKFVVQIVAALVAVFSGNVIEAVSNPNVFSSDLYWELGWLSIPVTVIWIVAITNAVNLIDGLDGLACGVSTISSLTMLVISLAVAVAQGSAELDHINIQFTNTQNDRSVTKILRPEDFSEGVYADWISMSIYEPAGTYILDRLILQDENGAYVRYCRAEDREEDDNYLTLPFTAAFQIDNGVTVLDETAPVLGAVAVSPVQAGKKTEITVAAAVADDFSGVDSVTVRFESEKGDAVSVELSDAGGGLFTGTIKDSETDEAGTYRVKKVAVSDRMGNSKTYYGGDGPFASDVLFVIS